jgi:hypothetical protein
MLDWTATGRRAYVLVNNRACRAPLKLRTDRFSFVTNLFIKNSVASEAPLLKGHPGALARDSVERASAVLRRDGFE